MRVLANTVMGISLFVVVAVSGEATPAIPPAPPPAQPPTVRPAAPVPGQPARPPRGTTIFGPNVPTQTAEAAEANPSYLTDLAQVYLRYGVLEKAEPVAAAAQALAAGQRAD